MKDEALSLVRGLENPAQRLNILREYLQACVLRSLHESEAFRCLSFVGGTALRFLFNLPRFSEDLDFSLENRTGYQPEKWMAKVKRDMSLAGFDVTLSWNDHKTVHVAWVRISGLLQEAGIGNIPEQKLSVKLEVDTNPPEGAVLERHLVNRHLILAIQHHDLQSMLAGKIHALIARSYPKGRDWYDFVWYCAKSPPILPNLTLLQAALDQTEGSGGVDAANWKEHVCARLESLREENLAQDAAPFLEQPQDAAMLSIENLRSLL